MNSLISYEETVAETWSVKSPSIEYLNLPCKLKEEISHLLAEYPVRIGEIAKKLGIKVLLSTLPIGISGQIVQEGEDFVIRINRHDARHRQRFTLAHEIAHYLLHKEKIIASGGWSEDVFLRSGQSESIEHEANRLALDLVLPSELLAKAANEYSSSSTTDEVIEDLARKFKVSPVAMEMRLLNKQPEIDNNRQGLANPSEYNNHR